MQRQTLTLEQLKRLAPLHEVPDTGLMLMLRGCKVLNMQPGVYRPTPNEKALYFLLAGKVNLPAPNGDQLVLADNSRQARYPLAFDAERPLRFDTPGRLLMLPERYLALAARHRDDTLMDRIDVRETGIDGQVYLDFYHELKSGKCELPSMPDIAVRIGRAVDNPDTLNSDIAKLIQLDPSLSARIMSVVNSAAYAATEKISSVQAAVSRLGRQQIRNLVYSMILKSLFYTNSKMLKSKLHALWEHSCHVAAICFILARHTRGLDPDHAMLAGLVHDIGVVPILSTARKHPVLLENMHLLEQVVEEMRADIGALTLSQWGLEADLIRVARLAEDWWHSGFALPDYLDVVLLAQLHAAVGTPQMRSLPRIGEIPAFEKIAGGKLDPRASMAILHSATDEISELKELLRGA